MEKIQQADVLVVGAGPTGLILAHELLRRGAAEVAALGCSLSLILATPVHTKILSASWPSVDALRASAPKRLGACRPLPPAAPGSGDEGDL